MACLSISETAATTTMVGRKDSRDGGGTHRLRVDGCRSAVTRYVDRASRRLARRRYLIMPALVERLRALAATTMAMISQKAPAATKVRFIGPPLKTGKSPAISEMSATVRNIQMPTVSRFVNAYPISRHYHVLQVESQTLPLPNSCLRQGSNSFSRVQLTLKQNQEFGIACSERPHLV